MNCEHLMALLNDNSACEATDIGTKFITHCLYPSFDPVAVYIETLREGFRVTDGGGASRSALMHGRDPSVLATAFQKAAKAHMVEAAAGLIIAKPTSVDWLYPSILAVANASAMAATVAADTFISADENALKVHIFDNLKTVVSEANIARHFEYRGNSGNVWKLDFAVVRERILLVKGVTPHRNSVNANYATFSDIGDAPNLARFSVFDRRLKGEDQSLIGRVANLVPLVSVIAGAERELSQSLH